MKIFHKDTTYCETIYLPYLMAVYSYNDAAKDTMVIPTNQLALCCGSLQVDCVDDFNKFNHGIVAFTTKEDLKFPVSGDYKIQRIRAGEHFLYLKFCLAKNEKTWWEKYLGKSIEFDVKYEPRKYDAPFNSFYFNSYKNSEVVLYSDPIKFGGRYVESKERFPRIFPYTKDKVLIGILLSTQKVFFEDYMNIYKDKMEGIKVYHSPYVAYNNNMPGEPRLHLVVMSQLPFEVETL